MRYVSFRASDGTVRIGVLVQDGRAVLDVGSTLADRGRAVPDLRALIADPAAAALVVEIVRADGFAASMVYELSAVQLVAPLRPGKVIGVGLNYAAHVDESNRTLDTAPERPERPVLFSKPATAVIGPGEPILHDAGLTKELDWECELAVVIGRTARRVSAADALEYVFGYSIMNDVSARDQRRGGQWFFSKGQDSYAPFGPVVVTRDEIADPHRLRLGLSVNGSVMQDGSTTQMLFAIPELIADITSGVTLEPGDVISTGSPAGVGAAQVPPRYLQPGDVVEASVEGIGTLMNPVEASA